MINLVLLVISIVVTPVFVIANITTWLLFEKKSWKGFMQYCVDVAISIDQTLAVISRNFLNKVMHEGGRPHGDGDLTASAEIGWNATTKNLLWFGYKVQKALYFIDIKNRRKGKDHCEDALVKEYWKAVRLVEEINNIPELKKLVSEQRPS